MYKKEFYIAMSRAGKDTETPVFDKVVGYGESLRTRSGRKIEFGFDRRDGGWHITEITTGLGLGAKYTYPARMEALRSIDDETLHKVEQALQSERSRRLTKKLSDFINKSN